MRLLLILLIAAVSGCDKKQTRDTIKPVTLPVTPAKPDTTVKLTYLALGDSYTIGESVVYDQNFPNQLTKRLNIAGYKVSQPHIIARTGWTTNELIDAIEREKVTEKFDFVTLLIGVNNQYRGYDINVYRKEFVELLNTAISFANGKKDHVFVVSIPDYGVTPFGMSRDPQKIAQEIDAYNAINKEESVKAGVNYVDITPISRQAATQPDLVAADGLHPSAKMYTAWVNLLEPAVEKQF
ncbi:SGNH/GDSL hydrolase family protein [Mucilaginibacter limnophilus]|uniref:SGNH/GDSL hydrolase family protein n=1 Tax=Mucilaginibacter limnophilus TaxID=1932778 RepID=A0A437MWA1_9SPHI|nr:SGNH/GDSL hydrolase family protein [Mucilaginibacter limnophilus]RVU01928.1 SGNH/GDSL hydrolase family protein [Mucilaginibacter limnophilus]